MWPSFEDVKTQVKIAFVNAAEPKPEGFERL